MRTNITIHCIGHRKGQSRGQNFISNYIPKVLSLCLESQSFHGYTQLEDKMENSINHSPIRSKRDKKENKKNDSRV